MIVGLGIDVCELDRIERILERHGQRFAARICTEAERAELHTPTGPRAVAFLAARFAAKEAAAKALGTGFRRGVGFRNIEVRHLPSGKPTLMLYGASLEIAESLGASAFHISLTHGRDVAAAVVVLET